MRWKTIDLSDCCDVLSGYAFKSSYFGDKGIPIVRIRDVVRGFSETMYQGEYKSEYLIDSGDILIGMDGDFNLAKWKGGKALLNQRVCKIIPKVGIIDPQFLFYYLPIALQEIWVETPYVTVKHLSVKKVNSIKVPFPPIAEQIRIAAVLEKADNLRQQSQQMEQELNSLAQSVFLDMFGDPKSNPKRWQRRPLKSILEKLVGGKSLAAPEQHTDVSEYRVLKISAVTTGQYNPLESKALPAGYIPPKEHFVQVNDLLISRANTTELVGATTMVFDTPENLLLPDKLWKFQWKESEPLSQIFMWKLLSSKAMRHRLSEISSGSGGSMKNISKSKLLELEVIFPDYEKQMEYENFYLRLRDQMLLNKEYISQAEGQFKSIMQRAFKGELDLKDVA